MRTIEQISKLQKNQGPSFQIDNFLSPDKVSSLLEFYHSEQKIVKNTGPKVVFVEKNQGIIDDILSDLEMHIGNFSVRSAHFFDVTRPHVLHIDDDFDLPDTYKAITLPLYINGDAIPSLYMFDQYYYNGPAKFFNGKDKVKNIHYNKPVFEYSDVYETNSLGIPKEFLDDLTHLDSNWLDGLSVNNKFSWKIGSAIIFDSLRIHCANNFLKQGITQKIGLSIFTKLSEEKK